MNSFTFLIAGDQKADGPGVVRIFLDEGSYGIDHRREARFHVGGTSSVQQAVTDGWFKGRRLPIFWWPRRNHIRMTREHQVRRCVCATRGIHAAPCPKIVNAMGVELFRGEAKCAQHIADEFLAASVLGCDRYPPDQGLG